MSATTPAGQHPYYFIPAPSRYPALVAFGLLLVIFGAGQWVNGHGWGAYVLLAGMVDLAVGAVPVVPRRPSAKAKAASTPTASTCRSAGA